jgi:hypothetical protein
MNKKYAGLPIWAWGLVAAAGVWLYVRSRASASASAAPAGPTDQVLDPNAIDPNTGLTYGQEESSALSQAAPGSSGSPPDITGFDSELQDWLQTMALLGQYYQQQGWTPPNSSGSGSSGSGSGSSGSGSSTPPPTQKTSPPTSKPTPHYAAVGTWVGNWEVLPGGSKKPTAPAGMHVVGTGDGGWIAVPDNGTVLRGTGAQAKIGQWIGDYQVIGYGSQQPKAPPGFHVVGTGDGGWIAVPNPAPTPAKKTPAPAKKPPTPKLGPTGPAVW